MSQKLNQGLLTGSLVLWSLDNCVAPSITHQNSLGISLGITPVKIRATFFSSANFMWQPLEVCSEELAQRKWPCTRGSSALAGNSRSKLEGTYLKANEWVVQQALQESRAQQSAGKLGALCLHPYSTSSLLIHICLTREMPRWWSIRWEFVGETVPSPDLSTAPSGKRGWCRKHTV